MRRLLLPALALGALALLGLSQTAQADPYRGPYCNTPPGPEAGYPPERAAVVSVVNDTDDQMVIHINGDNVGWLKPRQTRDFPLGRGKTVVSANSHDGDVYVHTFDRPEGFVVWYINEGH